MKEITIGKDHMLPYGYYYEKPIPTEIKMQKTDEQIINELAGSMPLSEIARITDRVREPIMETELRAKICIDWDNGELSITVYPITDLFPDVKDPLLYKYHTQPYIYRVDKYRKAFTHEKLNQIIYNK